MTLTTPQPHWLDQYASSCFDWQTAQVDGETSFYRPLGLVEFCFDIDGRYYEGRADINLGVTLSLESRLGKEDRQRHITLAWACLRSRHILAQARAPAWQNWMHKPPQITHEHCLEIDVPRDSKDAIEKAAAHVDFLEDHYDSVDPAQFYTQAQLSARILDPDKALARLIVLPLQEHSDTHELSCLFVAAHQIGDGLSLGRWAPDFTRLLNMTSENLELELNATIQPAKIASLLPKAQEALYPPVKGSMARQRWFWLLTRILRHVRKPLPAAFENPLLKRTGPSTDPIKPLWNKVLNYDRQPATPSVPVGAALSHEATARMGRICRSAGVSVGAGCFALAALLMMEFYEQRESIPLELRKPFITGFPLNPRPFLTGNPSADSLMLGFSDGILLPFLPSTLDLEGRLRLLAKAAQRQLAVYQKRSSLKPDQDGLQYMSSRGAGRMLCIQYLSSFERCEMLLPVEKQQQLQPQGIYAMRPNTTRQTCGVSSTGRRAPLNAGVKHENDRFVATATSSQASVRAREGEFLIGISGTEEGIVALVSADASLMDPQLIKAWTNRFEHILEQDSVSKL